MKAAADLAAWVALRHKGQLIRKTADPYFKHLTAVAALAATAVRLGYEIGLCHDLLEDTRTTAHELFTVLNGFGYANEDAQLITSCVVELTDVFTAKAYPGLRKEQRKSLETARLLQISNTSQTVKYSDLIDNVKWVLKYDHKHAQKYLLKKKLLLEGLIYGEQLLRQKAIATIADGLQDLAFKSV